MKRLFFICLCLPALAWGMELDTPGFKVTIESGCGEGEVACDDYTYTGTSKRSGNSITLQGSSWHTVCADGVTPCRFIGYRFRNGNVVYRVYESGLLEVIEGEDRVLVRQQGTWH